MKNGISDWQHMDILPSEQETAQHVAAETWAAIFQIMSSKCFWFSHENAYASICKSLVAGPNPEQVPVQICLPKYDPSVNAGH